MNLTMTKPFHSSGQGTNTAYAVRIIDNDRTETVGKTRGPWMVAVVWGMSAEEAKSQGEKVLGALKGDQS